jgi:hypothetical protein
MVDLGHQPPSNSFLTEDQLNEPETYYPLKVYVCEKCFLVQLPESKKVSEIFNETYPYYSSQSPANVQHAKEYVEMMVKRFGFNRDSRIIEIGSNDGYLLQWFKKKGCKVLGFEPASGPGLEAEKSGIPTLGEFWGKKIASEALHKYNLICGINVLNHQPDLNDFVEGLPIHLAPTGVITFEFPHLMKMVEGVQFDTIYHEHLNYFSFTTICNIFKAHGLEVFDVDEIPEHGGSLRIYAQHDHGNQIVGPGVFELRDREWQQDMRELDYYQGFQRHVDAIKTDLVRFLFDAQRAEKIVVGYGAAAKGNTLLNYCKIGSEQVICIVDRSPHKQELYLPGSHIKVVDERSGIRIIKPDYILILAWNLKEEIVKQLDYTREWECKFVIPIPKLEVI